MWCSKKYVNDLVETKNSQAMEIRKLQQNLSFADREWGIKKEEELNLLKNSMQQKLIESDLKRVEAESKLEAYLDMDTKTERQHINKMLEKAIDGLAQSKVQIVK